MKPNHILFTALMAACLPALADAPAPQPAPHVRTFVMPRIAGPLFHGGKIVKNAPYSAEVLSEQVQRLADGNEIVRKSSELSYRDSAGRTRHEVMDDKGQVRLVTIRDTDGVLTLLHPEKKTATRVGAPREMAKAAREAAAEAREAARARIEELRREGRLPANRAGEEIVIRRVERLDGQLQRDIQENVRIRMKALDGADGERMGAVLGGAFGDRQWSKDAVTRDLGTREFDGVKAEGKVRSYEIPAGEIGNRHPITVAHETWYSPELQVTVYSKHSDPRNGERVYRLDNLKRAEPAAALFAVPSDYTVKESGAARRVEKK